MKTLLNYLHFAFAIVMALFLDGLQILLPFIQVVKYAETQNPVTGRMRGLAGGMVFSKWNGMNTMRSYNANPQPSNTPKQLNQRAKFKLVQEFMSKALPIVRIGFAAFQIRQTAFNEAMSRALNNSVTGTPEIPTLDYPSIQVSDGSLIDLGEVTSVAEAGGHVVVEWTRDDDSGNGSANDPVYVLLVAPNMPFAVVSLGTIVSGAGVADLTVPADWDTEEVHVYIYKAGTELSGTVKSPSQYGGSVQIAV